MTMLTDRIKLEMAGMKVCSMSQQNIGVHWTNVLGDVEVAWLRVVKGLGMP